MEQLSVQIRLKRYGIPISYPTQDPVQNTDKIRSSEQQQITWVTKVLLDVKNIHKSHSGIFRALTYIPLGSITPLTNCLTSYLDHQ